MRVDLPFSPSEDPFVVEHGGFYRRWVSMVHDVAELKRVVQSLEGTTDDLWVPVWRNVGSRYEARGDELAAKGDHAGARAAFLQAKTYYSIGRFPAELTELKRDISNDCSRAYQKACADLEPPLEVVDLEHEGFPIRAHFRAPQGLGTVPAVLVICGADVFKEDRGWAQDLCMTRGMASLVVDGPGTGENSFPWAPESVSAWNAVLDYLASRPEVDRRRVGAFGISRGGYSVMQLAGTEPQKLSAVVAIAGHPFGYVMPDEELEAYVESRNRRAGFLFGAPNDGPSFDKSSVSRERTEFKRWSLAEQGIVDNITMPVLMINGKRDHVAPIGNIYFMLETGPVAGKEARIYHDAGHCAFKYFDHWAPAAFDWLAARLTRPEEGGRGTARGNH
ncbi:MAG TPA: alpha/beta hydrolase [Rhodothermales bacterium]|nr:alpha/beta hydrolase [Rhodothermales bacterium]